MPTLRSIAARVRLDPVYYRPETQPWTAAGHGAAAATLETGPRRSAPPVVALLDSGVNRTRGCRPGRRTTRSCCSHDPGLPVSWTSPVAATEQSGHARSWPASSQ